MLDQEAFEKILGIFTDLFHSPLLGNQGLQAAASLIPPGALRGEQIPPLGYPWARQHSLMAAGPLLQTSSHGGTTCVMASASCRPRAEMTRMSARREQLILAMAGYELILNGNRSGLCTSERKAPSARGGTGRRTSSTEAKRTSAKLAQ